MVRKASLAAACAAIVLTGSLPAFADDAAPSVAQDFQMKRCVNMGNALEAPNGAPWGRLYSEADYARIAEAGFDTVRIPIRWSDYTGPAPTYRIHPDFAEVVDNNVRWALKNDLNIVLNIHHFEEIMEQPESQMERYRAIWDQISLRLSLIHI